MPDKPKGRPPDPKPEFPSHLDVVVIGDKGDTCL